MSEENDQLLEEKNKLKERLGELAKEKNDIETRINDIDCELGVGYIERLYGISVNDTDKKCRRNCEDCIMPCSSCPIVSRRCDQCAYGYCSVVDKIKNKYSIAELDKLKGRCPYMLLAYETKK